MRTLFCVRPATCNIGNDVINKATAELLYDAFGSGTGIVNIPALHGAQFGGFTARQVFDMNRLADGVVIGGGNLFENGQLTVDLQALSALRVPMMLIGLSHGRIYDRRGELVSRSDSLPAATVRELVAKACVTLVRDEASRAMLEALDLTAVEVGGCPTLFLAESPRVETEDTPIIISVRHPGRMSIPAALQWRVPEDVRAIITGLRARFARQILIACHDYADIEFASGFPEAPLVYYDDVERYVQALRGCWLSITYRLHAFLPCLAFGTPSIHVSYDERGASMVATAGMSAWDVDMMTEPDVVRTVLARAASSDEYRQQRCAARPRLECLHQTTRSGVARFVEAVDAYARVRG
jgi:polysaccharide pyruvyl transferase WcaK-like protein